MIVAIPTELKNNENRVALTPAGAHELRRLGHSVTVQSGAGTGAGFSDDDYRHAGAQILSDADKLWADASIVVKVKEPIPQEYRHLREGLVLFTYLHLAANPDLTRALQSSGTTAIAYETVRSASGTLPLLAPMSEVAGRLATIAGAAQLLSPAGGRGVLLGGVSGTAAANVVVIGGGVAGEQAAANALGLGARVTVIDRSLPRLRQLEDRFDGRISTRASSHHEIAAQLRDADLVIGSVLIPGAQAPKLVTDEMVAQMKPGAVLVDIAIDQGGCFEGSRPTTHDAPTFRVHDTVFSCVANLPGAVPVTATQALTNATLPYLLTIAERGWLDAARSDAGLAQGINVVNGQITNAGVARALDEPVTDLASVLGA